nr:MAG: major capsid protein [Microvirus sp.]
MFFKYLIMGLFSYDDLKNHPRRSGFDLTKRICFTSKAGELLPVYWKPTIPGDKWNISTNWFTRTQPVDTAAYTRIKEYVDWFFVPLNLIQKGIESAITQMVDNPVSAKNPTENKEITTDLPYTKLSSLSDALFCLNGSSYTNKHAGKLNMFGFSRADLSYKLLQMLKYGNLIKKELSVENNHMFGYSTVQMNNFKYLWNQAVSVLPIFCYQKIYADYFRFQQWEKPVPYTYNVDYYSGGDIFPNLALFPASYWESYTPFDLRYCNWNRDLYTGFLPSQQFGDVALVETQGLEESSYAPIFYKDTGWAVTTASKIQNGSSTELRTPGDAQSVPANTPIHAKITASLTGSFNVLALRQAEFLQKWKEIALSGDQDYRSQIEKHFGVKLPAELSYMSQYIGGQFAQMDISEVVNQNLADQVGSDAAQYPALIAGKGVNSGDGIVNYDVRQHGIIMGIYHAVPLLDYERTGQDQDLLITSAEEWAIPEFDAIGMQTLPLGTLFNACVSGSQEFVASGAAFPIGYVPRYFNWKTDIDEIFGAFRSSEKTWVAPIDADFITNWIKNVADNASSVQSLFNYNWFKVNPAILDDIFAVKADSTMDTDTFKTRMMMSIKCVRNLDYSGMPY